MNKTNKDGKNNKKPAARKPSARTKKIVSVVEDLDNATNALQPKPKRTRTTQNRNVHNKKSATSAKGIHKDKLQNVSTTIFCTYFQKQRQRIAVHWMISVRIQKF